MTPAARLSAAIDVLDRILAGQNAEQVLTNWGRASRFAGSGDRAAVRDLVYDAMRCRRSFAALGGAETGRGLVLGGVRDAGLDPAALFTGEGHAPAPVTDTEGGHIPQGLVGLDCPDWLGPALQKSLGPDFEAVLRALRQRAPVFLRVNLARLSREKAIAVLAEEGVSGQAHPLANTAIEVVSGARKIQNTTAYQTGLVELQDAASQAVAEALPLVDGMRVLDYCAGGGGKTLAMAARARLDIWAHDADPRRMRDLPARAERAGAAVSRTDAPADHAPYDLILTDVPCSGSGSWRRDPQGKWALTQARLDELTTLQQGILDKVAPMIAPNGYLAYATCSLLADENTNQISGFLERNTAFTRVSERQFTPLEGGDGFFIALLRRHSQQT
jgi:16S rRNA (cytosine967-C5)-methyltransferase